VNTGDIKLTIKKEKKESEVVNQSPSGSNKKKGFKIFILVVFILILLGALGYLGYQWQSMRKELQKIKTLQGTQELQKKQTEEIINKLKAHTVLPEDEQPIIATVIDAAALKKQSSFYELAKNGDMVIIYIKAKRAYLYDPIADRVLNIGPVLTGQAAQELPQPSPSPTTIAKTYTVEIRNGTEILGLGTEMAKKIKGVDASLDVLPATNADKSYTKTILVVKNADKSIVSKLEKELGVTAQTTVPEGERDTSANILIIVGK